MSALATLTAEAIRDASRRRIVAVVVVPSVVVCTAVADSAASALVPSLLYTL